MKIAILTYYFPKLSETFILTQIKGLIDLGHDITIFAAEQPNESFHKDVGKYNLEEKVCYYKDIYSRKGAMSRLTILLHVLRHPFLMCRLFIFLRKGIVPTHVFFEILPLIGKHFDVYHSHFIHPSIHSMLIKESGVKGRFISSFHGGTVDNWIDQLGEEIYRQVFHACDAVTYNTNYTKNKLLRLGCFEEKTVHLAESLDLTRFEYLEKTMQKGREVRLVTVGRLTEKKGHEFSLRAIANIVGEQRSVHYTIAGDGELRGYLEDLAKQLGIDSHVKFLGSVTQEEVIQIYKEAHIFIMPCVTAKNKDEEGQALVLQEAQACGLPILSTYHNGIPEGVLDGKSGFLVPERDVPSLTERLRYLLDHPEEWAEMGRSGRSFVESKYDQRKLNIRLEEIYLTNKEF